MLGCGGGAPSAPAERPKGEQRANARAKAISAAMEGEGPAANLARGRLQTLANRLTRVGTLPTARKDLRRISELEEGEPALVVFVVMDTLRADRAHMCGFDKPNTPVLDQLISMGATWTCDAYSPATWTLPAHASYFTGVTTAEHGVHTLGTPLVDEYETIAETYAARGYQTMFLSANPVFNSRKTGFWQGFDRVVVAQTLMNPLRNDTFAPLVQMELEAVSKDHPLFLFVNIFDSHDPFPPVPKGVPWASPQKKIDLHPHTADAESPYYQYVTDTMAEDDKPKYLDTIVNGYDHAVYVSDRNLGGLLKVLRRFDWLKKPHRAIVTSDHGEHLGEHGLLRHGSATWQTVTRVPLLYFTGNSGPTPELPSPVNVSVVHELLLNGKIPDDALLVESASGHNKDDFKPSWNTVSLWESSDSKLQYFDGEWRRFDLSVDPMEDNPLPLADDHPMMSVLAERVEAHDASIAKALDRGPDDDIMKALQAVGYVQDDE
jgi:hypothetical protein